MSEGRNKGECYTFFGTRGGSRGMGGPCLVTPRLSWNCRTRLRTSGWSVSTCLRGRRSTLDCTLGASHLNEKGSGSGQGEGRLELNVRGSGRGGCWRDEGDVSSIGQWQGQWAAHVTSGVSSRWLFSARSSRESTTRIAACQRTTWLIDSTAAAVEQLRSASASQNEVGAV